MNKITIRDTSDLVFPYDRYGKTGRVHSIFSNSLNLIVKDQLIHISSSEKFLSGFGISIGDDDFQKLKKTIKIGNLVVFKDCSIIIYNSSRVHKMIFLANTDSLKKQEIRKAFFSIYQIKDLLEQLEESLVDQQIGLINDKEFRKVQKILTANSLCQENIELAMKFLIGRGLGLTPSGDDIILGYAVGLRIFTSIPIIEYIRNFSKYWPELTTDVSNAYLNAFLKNRISSPVYRLNTAIISEKYCQIEKGLQEVKEIGNTSGSDFLFGLILALTYIVQNYENTRVRK